MFGFFKKSVQFFPVRKLSSYAYLNITQFLGALNDNIYKLLIVYFFIQQEGSENSHTILALTGAAFVLPFILFSASSGLLADRFSKRNIIIGVKIFELLLMVTGIVAFEWGSKSLLLLLLFGLATHSAVFSPSKYGILPELVSSDKISEANGIMSLFTFLAIIIGTFSASFILDISGRNFLLAASLCAIFSTLGFLASLCIEYTVPSGSSKRFNLFFVKEIIETISVAKKTPSLLWAMFGSAYFLFIGSFVQLNVIPYAINSLGLSDVRGGYLFLLMALGIGSGSFAAGKLSGKVVELGFVPIAAFGVAACLFGLDFFSSNLLAVIIVLMLLGFFGGLYQVPLDSYIQVSSPDKVRGQVIAVTNFFSFIGVLTSSFLVWSNRAVLSLGADKGFVLVGLFTLAFALLLSREFFDYVSRLVAHGLCRLHFDITYRGLKNVPEEPAIYVVTHKAWNETLILLACQKRRIRFFLESEKHHTRFMKSLYRLLRIVLIPVPEPLENNIITLNTIRSTLEKGISVAIFVDHIEIHLEIERLKKIYPVFQSIPLIPVTIEQGNKRGDLSLWQRLFAKFRVPCAISFE